MKTISYIPSKDELLLKFGPIKGSLSKKFGGIKLWWDTEGNIRGIQIKPFTKESEEFTRNLNTMRLGSIWKGVKVTTREIRETRAELLRKLEGKW